MNIAHRPEAKTLFFAIPPLLTYLFSSFILEFGGLGFGNIRYALPAMESQSVISTTILSINDARVVWLSSVLLFITVACAVIAISLLTLYKTLDRKGFSNFVVVGIALGIGGLMQLAFSIRPDSNLRLIFQLTYDSICAANRFTETETAAIAALVSIVNMLAVIVPPFLMLACCSQTILPDAKVTDPRHFLFSRMNKLKLLIHFGSAMLVAGSLHMLLWLRFPIAFVADAELHKAIGTWALSLTLYCGMTYSLMLAGLYVPCSMKLIHNTEILLKQRMPELSDSDIMEWKNKHGFSTSPLQQIPQIIAALAPTLAGPIGSAVAGFSLTLS
ncbi:hypothetical protein [Methylomonas sp. MgM2]